MFPLFLFPDVDECHNPETNECDINAECNNTGGSYTCACTPGYQGDGKNCPGKSFSLFSLDGGIGLALSADKGSQHSSDKAKVLRDLRLFGN